MTCSSSTITDYILARFSDRVSKQDVIDVGLSDHQIICCTIKTSRMKRCTHKQIRCRSLTNYPADIYEEGLGRLDFPNYHNFQTTNDAYSNFTQKVMEDIDLQSLTKYIRLNSSCHLK